MIILISGRQGSGKTTLARKLLEKLGACNALNHRFAQPLYEMHNSCRAILEKYQISGYDYSIKDGDLLQILGTEWGRKRIRETVWVECTLNAIRLAPQNIIHIIEDARFRNEFDMVKAMPDVITIRLNCPEEIRKERVEMWRDNTTHPSEIDLDEYAETDKFDMNFNTSIESVDDIATKVVARIRLKNPTPQPLMEGAE